MDAAGDWKTKPRAGVSNTGAKASELHPLNLL